jgi:hypothetical protein
MFVCQYASIWKVVSRSCQWRFDTGTSNNLPKSGVMIYDHLTAFSCRGAMICDHLTTFVYRGAMIYEHLTTFPLGAKLLDVRISKRPIETFC